MRLSFLDSGGLRILETQRSLMARFGDFSRGIYLILLPDSMVVVYSIIIGTTILSEPQWQLFTHYNWDICEIECHRLDSSTPFYSNQTLNGTPSDDI